MQRAAQYRARAAGGPAEVAPFDEQVWQLAESRLPEPLYRHSSAVRAAYAEMAEACWLEPAERMVIVRDLSLAAGLHDWFSDVDPARLLVLAREWDLPISGVEWANPVLLHGRLAVEVARALYDAETRLGTERFHRIERIVLHHTVGACDATLAEKVFALADWRSRSPESAREPLPSTAARSTRPTGRCSSTRQNRCAAAAASWRPRRTTSWPPRPDDARSTATLRAPAGGPSEAACGASLHAVPARRAGTRMGADRCPVTRRRRTAGAPGGTPRRGSCGGTCGPRSGRSVPAGGGRSVGGRGPRPRGPRRR